MASGHFSMSTHFYESTLKFFQSNVKDNSDFMIISYKFGSFLKIGEFLEFRDKLNNSLLHYFVKVELFLLELLTSANHQAALKKAPSDCLILDCDTLKNLEDNRNDNVFNICNPSNRRSTPELLRKSFELDVSFLKIRIFTLRSIIAAVEVSKRSMTAMETLNIAKKSLETLINELKETKSSQLPKNVLSGVSKPRLFLYVESPYYFPYICKLLIITQKLGELDFEAAADQAEEANSILNQSVDTFARILSDSLDSRLQERENLTVLIEMFCLSAVFCGIFSSLAKTDKIFGLKQSKKKAKKETATSIEQRNNPSNRKVSCDTIYITNVLKAGKELEATLSTAAESWVQSPNIDFSMFLISPVDNTSHEEDFQEAISSFLISLKSSYGSSITESSNLLTQKLKFIQELNVK
nr:PREDICTED: N-alpha-acetyltransferase 25, NatB auxiliary subunit-like [Bemisia tabaci]